MTNREFFTNIANGTLTDVEKEFAVAAIEKLDATNAKRKEKAAEGKSKKALENAPLADEAFTHLGSETKTASDIATAMSISSPKATVLLKMLVADGRATVEDIKVPGKGTVKGYTAVIAE